MSINEDPSTVMYQGAHRPGRDSFIRPERQMFSVRDAAALRIAVVMVRAYLWDEEWHPASVAEKIAEKYGVTTEALYREAGVAESESGKWVCLAIGDGPESAPDEK